MKSLFSKTLIGTLAVMSSLLSFASVSVREQSAQEIILKASSNCTDYSSGNCQYPTGIEFYPKDQLLFVGVDNPTPIEYQDFEEFHFLFPNNGYTSTTTVSASAGEYTDNNGYITETILNLNEHLKFLTGDFNGDGKPDAFYLSAADSAPERYLPSFIVYGHKNSSRIPEKVQLLDEIGGYEAHASIIDGVRIQDVNQDGRDDIVFKVIGEGVERVAYAGSNGHVSALSADINYASWGKANRPHKGTLTSGGTPLDFRVDESGAATLMLSPYMPSGPGGVLPELALSYSSHSGGNGQMGIGWNLSGTSSIFPCPATSEVDGYTGRVDWVRFSNNEFCLDGQRLIKVGNREYRTENDQISKIVIPDGIINLYSFSSFEVYGKDGTKQTYEWFGTKYAYPQYLNASFGLHHRGVWNRTRIEDSSGNIIEYHYDDDESGLRLASITYGDNKIEFGYETRNDISIRYSWGDRKTYNKRLNTLKVYDATMVNTPVREYYFEYDHADANGASLLRYIQECGKNTNTSKLCHDPVEFVWSTPEPSTQFLTLHNYYDSRVVLPETKYTDNAIHDFNGDGYPDVYIDGDDDGRDEIFYLRYSDYPGVAWIEGTDSLEFGNTDVLPELHHLQPYQTQVPESSGGYRTVWRHPNDSTDYSAIVPFCQNAPVTCLYESHIQGYLDGRDKKTRNFIDFNKDGFTDIVVQYDGIVVLFLNTTELGSLDIRFKTYKLGDIGSLNTDGKLYFVDWDGDGLEEIIVAAKENRNQDRYLYLIDYADSFTDIRNILDGGNIESNITNRSELYKTYGSTVDIEFADMNGDGMVDVFGRASFIDGDYQTKILVQNLQLDGSTVLTQPGLDLPSALDIDYGRMMTLDINGDGLTDVITETEKLFINNGIRLEEIGANLPQNWKASGSKVLDYNMDGKADLLVRGNDNEYSLYLSSGESFYEVSTPSVINEYDQNIDLVIQDISADGIEDIVYFGKNTGKVQGYFHRVEHTDYNVLGTVVSMPQIIEFNSSGLSTYIEYKSLNSDYMDKVYFQDDIGPDLRFGNNSPVVDIQSSSKVVSKVHGEAPVYVGSEGSAMAGSVDFRTLSVGYRYQGNKVQLGRGGLGFRLISSIDYTSGIVTTTEYAQNYPYIGMPLISAEIKYSDIEVSDAGFSDIINQVTQLDYDLYQTSTGGAQAFNSSTNDTWYQASACQKFFPDSGSDNRLLSCSISKLSNIARTNTDSANINYPYVDESAEYSFNADGDATQVAFTNTTIAPSQSISQFSGDVTYLSTTTLELDQGALTSSQIESGSDSFNKNSHSGPVYETITQNEYEQNNFENWHLGRLTESVVTTNRSGGALDCNAVTTVGTGSASCSSMRTTTYDYYLDTGYLKTSTLDTALDTEQSTVYTYDSFGNKETVTVSAAGEVDKVTQYEYTTDGRYPKTTKESWNTATDLRTRSDVQSFDAMGNPTMVTTYLGDGENTFISETGHDAFGRPLYSSNNRVGTENLQTTAYGLCRSYSGCPEIAFSYKERSGFDGSRSREYFDVSGQSVRKSRLAFDGRWVHTDIAYDLLGRVVATSIPHYASGYFSYDNGPSGDSGIAYSVTEYDWLGRVTKEVHHDRSETEYLYGFRSLTAINSSGNKILSSYTEKNAVGENTLVRRSSTRYPQVASEAGDIRSYYDEYGNLTVLSVGAKDSPHHTVRSEYDNEGRKVAMNDPDKGLWHYEFYASGNLKKQTDAVGNATEHQYDARGRVSQKWVSDLSGNKVQHTYYEYDTQPNGFGKLARVYDTMTGYSQTYRYESEYGNVWLTKTTLSSGEIFQQATHYDRYGRADRNWDAAVLSNISLTNYGELSSILSSSTRTHFNDHGYVEKVTPGAGSNHYIKFIDSDVFGNVTQYSYGNDRVTTKLYDPFTGRLSTLKATTAAGNMSVMDYTYRFDDFGNIEERQDHVAGTLETYDYTWLNQVKSVTTTVNTGALSSLTESNCDNSCHLFYAYNQTYGHDEEEPWRLSQSNRFDGAAGFEGVYNYQAGNNRLDTITFADNTSPIASYAFEYDGNGNQVKRTVGRRQVVDGATSIVSMIDREITYNHWDKPASIRVSGRETHFTYGPSGSRTIRIDKVPGEIDKTTQYIGSVEYVTQGNTRYFKRMIAGVMVEVTAGPEQGISYLHKDHIGSLVAITDQNGVIKQRFSYDLYGKRRPVIGIAEEEALLTGVSTSLISHYQNNQPEVNRGFTSHEMLDNVGLIHMNGRIYDADLAIFLSADPHVQAPNNVLNTNRYSYVLDNPLSYTDPSGYFFKKLWKKAKRAVTKYYDKINQAGAWIDDNKKMIAMVAISIYMPGAFSYLGANAFWASALSGAVTGYLQTGTLKGAAMGAAFAGVSVGIGKGLTAMTNAGYSSAGVYATGILAHGVSGGVRSVLSGGSFGHGFKTAAVTKAFAPANGKMWGTSDAYAPHRLATAMIIGGTTSRLNGGKFSNGAATGFIVQLNANSQYANQNAQKGQGTSEKGVGAGIADGVTSLGKDVGRFFRYVGRSVGLYGSEEAELARQEGLIVDRLVGDCAQSSSCRSDVETATREYVKQNDSAYFRARVATRAILGGITGTGIAATHGAVDNAVENGVREANEFVPGIIYGAD